MKKKPLQVYLPDELISALKAEAEKQSRSRNSMIEYILRNYLSQWVLDPKAFQDARGIIVQTGFKDESESMTASEYAAALSKYSHTIDALKEAATATGTRTVYVAVCEKCKKENEVRKMFEEGVEHVICEECAKKAKLLFNKLEKLT